MNGNLTFRVSRKRHAKSLNVVIQNTPPDSKSSIDLANFDTNLLGFAMNLVGILTVKFSFVWIIFFSYPLGTELLRWRSRMRISRRTATQQVVTEKIPHLRNRSTSRSQ